MATGGRRRDERRREVVDNLRYCADMCHNVGVLDSDVLNALGIHCGDTDGVSSAYDVEQLADLIDRGECENVYDGSVQDSCDNGFLCSVCGCKVEDEEHYRVSGVWNYCPGCGRVVLDEAH